MQALFWGIYLRTGSGYALSDAFFKYWQELLARGVDSSNMADTNKKGNTCNGTISKTVASFQPASSSSLDSIWDPDLNSPVFDRTSKVKVLEKHWGQVFEEKSISVDAMDELLNSY